MQNKKIDPLFGITVIVFLVLMIILIKDFNAKRASDYKEYSADIANIVRMKNNKIRVLSSELIVKQSENADLENTLSQTRNDLDALSKKLAQPVVVTTVASAPAVVAKSN